MKSEDRYRQYCADIAELFLNLEAADERVKDWYSPQTGLERRILARIGLADVPSAKDGEQRKRWEQEVEDRERWLRRAASAIRADSRAKPVERRTAGQFTRFLLGLERIRGDEEATVERYQGWEARQTQLANQLVDSPWLLNCVLHALDRGDETYFLYLTRKVTEINEWLSEQGLWWFRQDDPRVPCGPARILQAWPWQEKEEALSTARAIAREKLKKCAFQFKVDSDSSGEKYRLSLQKKIDDYFDFKRKREFSDKIKSWKAAEVEKSAEREEAKTESQGPNQAEAKPIPILEQAVHDIFEARSKQKQTGSQEQESSDRPIANEPDEAETLRVEKDEQDAKTREDTAVKDLAGLLFRSPKQQSKLALLLGLPPSRWLTEEEHSSIAARRAFHTGSIPATDVETGVANKFKAPDRWKCPDPTEAVVPPQTPTGETGKSSAGPVSELFPLKDKIGLCFSGGGIRSATFNLGVLQALAEMNLLSWVDYLSTVSGGGYIHQWVAAWWKRATESASSQMAFQTVNKALVAQPASVLPGIEATQISFLRRFSNYLTPRKGLFTADSWTLAAIWMRNTFLNQLVLAAGFFLLFALLRLVLLGLENSIRYFSKYSILIVILALFAVAIFAARVSRQIWRFRKDLDISAVTHCEQHGDGMIAVAVLLLVLSALLFTVFCAGSLAYFPLPAAADTLSAWLRCLFTVPQYWAFLLPIAFVLVGWPSLAAFAGFTPKLYKDAHPSGGSLLSLRTLVTSSFLTRLRILASAVVAGVIVLFLLALTFWILTQVLTGLWFNHLCPSHNKFVSSLVRYACAHSDIWNDLLFVIAPPVLVAAVFLSSVLHVGLNKHVFRDELLEWSARLRAWGFLLSFAWIAVTGCLILSAPLVKAGFSAGYRPWSSVATALWAAISGGGALAAKGMASDDDSGWKGLAQKSLTYIAPYVFIAGVFVAVSALVSEITDVSGMTYPWRLIWLIVISAATFGSYGWGVDINEFSMHSFYRNRLARCYQGASVVDRRPDAFTGFSRDDRAVRLGELRVRTGDQNAGMQYPGPFPIFCCTANFTAGEDLAWQERKGASFAYTPLYSGYDVPWTGLDDERVDQKLSYNGFRDTLDLGHPNGPGLADVSAISGAAVSPAWGYHTNTATAFLMTCFNVRLGVWTRNTRFPLRDPSDRKQGAPSMDNLSPKFAPLHLLKELFGQANAKSEFLYLTDGGHFDNMGLYELVRRECRYIVVCDAEEDGNITFDGMAMALRKCRSDFGVEIDFDLRAMRKAPDTGQSAVHCVVGTILYPNEDPETPGRDRGKIVYMKSTLTGSEPADLLSYKLEHQAFPHDSTGDQWFSESQFESYRVLGRTIALTALKPACAKNDQASTPQEKNRRFFNRLYDIWYPVTPAIERHLSEHGAQFDSLLRELRSKDTIAAHANQIFRTGAVNLLSKATTADKEYFKAFALSIFDFMWRIFNDLDLQIASNRVHPQGEIWMNTFKRWTEMKFVRAAWPIYRDRYPANFHFFLGEHLEFTDTKGKRFKTP